MDRDDVAFPDPNEIAPHAVAFARMMFAHAEFEREVRALQDAITKEPGFGEQHDNQWSASESATEKIVSLIIKHRGSELPQIEQIKNLLTDAVHLCRQRNFPLRFAAGYDGSQSCRRRTAHIRCLASTSSLISSKTS